jgi:hypothetical protein
MNSLKKLAAVLILGAPFALLPAGCAMGVDDASNLDDSASLEASESQAVDVETADVAPELSTVQFDGRRGGRCRERCYREYRRCERFDHDRRDRHDGRWGDRCERRYRHCLSFCFRHRDHRDDRDHRGDH